WEAEIIRAELVTNYQLGSSLGNTIFVSTGTDLECYQPGTSVNFNAEIDTSQPSQNLKIEAILRDPNGNAVDFDDRPGSENFTINGTNIDPFTWQVNLPANAALGNWSIDISVFDADTDNFELLQTQTFKVGDETNQPPSTVGNDVTPPSSQWDFVTRDYNLNNVTDVVAIKKSGTGSGRTEVHIMSRANNYQSWLLQTATPLEETGDNFEFASGNYRGDGDILAIKKSSTGAGRTEVHILDAATNYQSFALQIATPLAETGDNFQFTSSDYNRDGVADLFAIKKSSTGSSSTEIHILDGASNYQSFLLQTGTILVETGDNFEFVTGDYNNDGFTDVLAIKKSSTGSLTTEVHVLNGASNYQSWLLQTPTVLAETGNEWGFLMDEYTSNNSSGIISLKESNTGTGTTEAHVFNGGTNYQNWLLQTGSILPEVNSSVV
ncbi:MAG: FG-GAP-like repeat-containing protein, partial [Coleofasciculaceae cyanobacterium]